MNSVPPDNSKTVQIERELFLVLDGGGARGIAHIAAWRGLQRLVARPGEEFDEGALEGLGNVRYRLRGVAGTSAGAIVASFIAAGADSRDLIDETGRAPLCKVLRVDYFHDIFGIRGWRRLKFIRMLISPRGWLQRSIDRLREAAESANLPGWQTMAAAGPRLRIVNGEGNSESKIETKRSAVSNQARIDRVSDMVIWSSLLGVLAFYTPELISFLNPYNVSAPVFTLLLWFSLNAAFISTGLIARSIERYRSQFGQRTYSSTERAILHPIASMTYALALTTLLSIAGNWLYYQGGPPPLQLGTSVAAATASAKRADVIVENVVWVICGVLFGLSFAHTVRRILKGGIAPEIMQADLETALRFVLRNKHDGWGAQTGHIWSDRQHRMESARKLASSLAERPMDQPITFAELFEATNIQLTVVAADTIRNEVVTFSANSHPNVSVAMAVSASMAIPLVFRPVRDGPRLLVDGGIVSSIPAWVFRRHRNRDPDCRILAVRIELNQFDDWIPLLRRYREFFSESLRAKGWPHIGKVIFWLQYPRLSLRWPRALFANILSTAAFGARALELDASDRLESFPLTPDVGLLDFDISPAKLEAELTRLQDESHNQIVNLLYDRAKVFEDVCAKIESVIRRRDIAGERSQNAGTVRMFWAVRDGDADSVRIKFTYGFDPKHQFDDRLVMPFKTSMSAWAMEYGPSQFAKGEVLSKMLSGPINRYRAAVKWRSIAWCWAISVRDPATDRVVGILAIESDQSLSSFYKSVGEEGDRRSDRWLNLSTPARELRGEGELVTVAKSSAVFGRMKVWEEDFAALVWKEFVSVPVRSNFSSETELDADEMMDGSR